MSCWVLGSSSGQHSLFLSYGAACGSMAGNSKEGCDVGVVGGEPGINGGIAGSGFSKHGSSGGLTLRIWQWTSRAHSTVPTAFDILYDWFWQLE